MIQPSSHQPVFQAPIKIYSGYRFLLSVLFLGIALNNTQDSIFPPAPELIISIAYFALAFSFFVGSIKQSLPVIRHTFIGFIIDIIFIALLESTALQKGVNLDLILIISVAAGSIVFIGPLGTAIAAIATIFLCLKEFFLNQLFQADEANNLRVALLGITFFATSWITQNLAKRLSESEITANLQARDIEHLQHLNEAIIERMRTGVTVFNQKLELEMMNLAASRLLSKDPAQAIAPEEGLTLLKESLNSWVQDIEIKQVIKLTDQSPEIKLGFTYLEGKSQIVIFLEDNTKIRQHAQQLKLASLGQLAASIAHEIRNPLAAVSYAAQLLEETKPTEEQLNLLKILLKHTNRMNDIVNNVLQISRREPPNIQHINLKEWLNNFIDTVLSSHQKECIDLFIDNELIVDFDPSHLSQVITNIIENSVFAVKQIENKRKPHIEIHAAHIENINRIFLSIADNGPGIPDEKMPHIFEPFFTTSKTGSGLGLFLCREICELNHARIHTLPSLEGCCFQILFKPRKPHE